MGRFVFAKLTIRAILIALAAAGPLAFPASQSGYGSLPDLAGTVVLPAALAMAVVWLGLRLSGDSATARAVSRGALAGAAATLALEAVRYTGFRLGFMPGNLPQLMGVLLLDRFAEGPSTASNLAGFAYHFWNGACFGVMFALGRFHLARWWAVPYALAVGLGFLLSPIVEALGAGLFGVNFGWHFAATVITAHLAFGIALAMLSSPRGVCLREAVGASPDHTVPNPKEKTQHEITSHCFGSGCRRGYEPGGVRR